jgi:hypothetical protein
VTVGLSRTIQETRCGFMCLVGKVKHMTPKAKRAT